MSELPSRARRAFDDSGAFERMGGNRYEAVTTPFEGVVDVDEVDGRVVFEVQIRLPTLSAAVEGHVADVVEEGWYETLELRIDDVDGATRGDHGLDPEVRLAGDEVVVAVRFEDLNPRRGVDDARAVFTYVEGTFVEGIIPGYDYAEPVASMLSKARSRSNAG